jgi:phosphopantothenoylcysteine decarboxylase/phosphopantothenate--cysteine ligase
LSLNNKKILLVIGGGIAAYKSLELIRRLRERSGSVTAILTPGGAEFITPLSVAALTGEKVHTHLFDLTTEAEIGHIALSRAADLVVVAPATADLMAKMAAGHANDLASTALLATDKRVLLAPAMNVRMWLHPATQRNIALLKADGVSFIGPNDGDMACGEFGPGRMAEPEEIVAAITQLLAMPAGPLAGTHALVTAGPTREPIDPVRFIANRSSGKQGYAIAAALAAAGAQTTLISGPAELAPPAGPKLVRVETAREMLAACEAALPVDVAVCTAAVADWRPVIAANSKLKKRGDGNPPSLDLTENPDILAALAHHARHRPPLVIGFAAETDDLLANAQAKLARKGCDWIVANDVSEASGVMGGDNNTVHLISAKRTEDWPAMSKADVAARLTQRIAEHFRKQAV